MDDDIIDANCDPKNPQGISIEDITTADFLLMDTVVKTPCTRAVNGSAYNMDLYFKKEFMQPTGSFKERGARFALLLLSDRQKQIGVITASTGNHALALSYHGNQLNIPVTVVLPIYTSPWKIEKCRSYNATVITEGLDISESRVVALVFAKERQLEYINGYDHPNVIAGCGTIGLEMLMQVPKIDAVIVPVGGGGLIAGLATTLKLASPNTKIIGVESEKCPSFARALENESPIYVAPNDSLAESLLVPIAGSNAYTMAAPFIDKLVVVREAWVALAMLRLVVEEECVVEGAAAVGLAAILAGQLNELQMQRVIVLLTGCNTSPPALGCALEQGLAAERRLFEDDCDDNDPVTDLDELFEKLYKLGLTLSDVVSETVWLKSVYKKEMAKIKQQPKEMTQEEAKRGTREESHAAAREDMRKVTEEGIPKPTSEYTHHVIQQKVQEQTQILWKHKKSSTSNRKAISKKHFM
ncbi:L-threonine dehydratase catabolic TdcB-like isoform X2 [Anastrepha obliqua]|uniref:L-threonine dehydratase catabolic TdcB-like isoform X2 n=1 Tax=Anastrepha obliqua TaxID=95512 RepID=UPI002409490F|nr:L-threonine dehydratase catabolic TdcB-like isoform X2 [Anastrepha obliqua]